MSNPLFQNILPEDIPIMLKRLHAYTKSYQKEAYIRHAGDPADFIGIIESGSIHILQDDYYGNRNITASISEGSLFGEAFSCAGRPFPVPGFLIFLWISWLRRIAILCF